MTSRPTFDVRMRAYTPLGDPAAVIPDLGLTIVAGPDGPTLTATVSTVIYGALPDDLEVAVEVWDGTEWVEGRDSRFVVNGQQQDDRDRTGTATLTGVGLAQWLASKAALAGVAPYSKTGNVEDSAWSSSVHVSGRTFTWPSHVLGAGDRVRVTSKGHSKGLTTGSVYYVRNATASTFQVSNTPTGALKSFGSATDVHLERVRTRIVFSGGHSFVKNQAISVLDANGSNLTDGSQYYVVNPTGATIQVATKAGGIPVELAANEVTVYRYLDGQRVWKNATPGQVLEDAFYEARNRGWGEDASGAAQVWHSWTGAADSNAYAWPARVDDPTITGVSIGFQPGTPLSTMVQFMLDNGWAEFASHERNFDLFAPNTGTDWTTPDHQSPRRLGTAAQQVQITKDLTDYRTAETVRGEANIETTVSGSRSPWGRLEVYTTAAGVTTSSHATSYGKGDLALYSAPSIGYQVTEPAQAAAWLPILDYQRGDWVQVQVRGAWTRLRVTQWTFQKATDGSVTVTVLLEKKKRSLLHKVAKASSKANAGRAVTTTSTTPPESDKRKAAQPASLTVIARTSSTADKSARGTVTASWLPVTTDTDGDDLTGTAYEVVVRADGEQTGKTVAVTKGTTVDLPALPAGSTVAVAVRAQSSTGEWGELTDEVEYVVDLPEDVPDAPSTPTVTSTLGSIVIGWDGNLVDPTDGPHAPETADALAFVQVQRSTDGATWTTEAQTLPAAGAVTDLGLDVGTAYQYRLVAVSQLGVSSAPSPVATATVVAVDTAQIDSDFTQQVTDAAAAAAAAQDAASGAVTAVASKSAITYSSGPATGTGGNAGDLWYEVSSTGLITGQWQWDGSEWVAQTIAGVLIAANTVTAAQLSATAIDAMTITGATFRTASTAKTAGGVQIDSTGLHGYNASGVATFALGTDGALAVTGQITATSGSVTGALAVTGSITAGSAKLDSTGLSVSPVRSLAIKYGQYVDADATFYGMDFALDPSGGTNLQDAYSHVGVTANGSQMTVRSGGGLTLKSNWTGTGSSTYEASLTMGLDSQSAPIISSPTIQGRAYANSTVSGNALVVITPFGTLGRLTSMALPDVWNTTAGSLNTTPASTDQAIVTVDSGGVLRRFSGTEYHPAYYSDAISSRALYVGSNGHVGTTSSSRRTKNLHRHIKMDDHALDVWLGLPTWEFDYKNDPEAKTQYGLVAEEVHDAGLTHLVYYDERDGDTKGQIDGFAYERMGVMNRMAMSRLYARLTAAEEKLARLEATR